MEVVIGQRIVTRQEASSSFHPIVSNTQIPPVHTISEEEEINDNAYFHWIIVVRNDGQLFKYSQKVIKYQGQYLGLNSN